LSLAKTDRRTNASPPPARKAGDVMNALAFVSPAKSGAAPGARRLGDPFRNRRGAAAVKARICTSSVDTLRRAKNMRRMIKARCLLPIASLTRGGGVALVLASIFFTASARADFRMCNKTSNRVSVALAYTDGQNWVSEGWWNLKPLDCDVLLRGGLAAQFYYVYAMDERGGEWKGKAFMCTSDREFKIDGRQDCYVRGYDRTGFFEVDTGKDAKNWTVQLTDPTAP
jgi:uncharacterized membrane protein